MVHNLFLVYILITTFFEQLWVHHQGKNCVFTTLGTCYSVRMTVWYAPRIPDSHPHRITSTKCRKNTAVSPDDGPTVARNM